MYDRGSFLYRPRCCFIYYFMSEKIENLLSLSLEVPKAARERSLALETGFDATEDTWEVVLRCFGGEEMLRQQFPDANITFLEAGYVIMDVTREQLDLLAELPQVIYIEMPKSLHFQVENGRRVSCINPLQRTTGTEGNLSEDLTGQGILVAVIDSGIDYAHPDFRNADGTTRIAYLWDQTLSPRKGEHAPEGFSQGVEYDEADINRALTQETEEQRYAICPSRDLSGHGTHVAGIAAGNGRAGGGRYRGVAYKSRLLVVKLGNTNARGFPRTTQLMCAITYCIRKAGQMGLPVAMNISIGNHYGSHAGDSLLETYIDRIADQWKCSIVVGMGNEGASSTHTSGDFRRDQRVEIGIGSYETGWNLQLWKRDVDVVEIALETGDGQILGRMDTPGTYRFLWKNTEIYVYFGIPSPYSIYQEIYFDAIPLEGYAAEGIFVLRFYPRRVVSGRYDLWLPAGGVLNRQTGFFYPTPETTLTIPSTAAGAVSVGAYNGFTREYAPFSGRGFTWETDQIKPDVVAPGVDVISCAVGGGYTSRSGTSMAAPFVTGSAALMMEWGIRQGHDPYLYGEKLKAALIRGARNLPFEGNIAGDIRPSEKIGWGALCTADSLI